MISCKKFHFDEVCSVYLMCLYIHVCMRKAKQGNITKYMPLSVYSMEIYNVTVWKTKAFNVYVPTYVHLHTYVCTLYIRR